MHKEPEEKAKRKNNVVIRSVPEEVVKSDSDLVQDIISQIGVEEFHVKSVTRLGKPIRNEQGVLKPRPIRIILSNIVYIVYNCLYCLMSKKNVLKRASMIRQRESEFYDCKNVFITLDHTILERESKMSCYVNN